MQTDHFVQTFRRMGRKLVAQPPQACRSADHAILRAEQLGQGEHKGAIAISVSGESEFGDFEPPVVLKFVGDVPLEFSKG
jgi:hypothetical protein